MDGKTPKKNNIKFFLSPSPPSCIKEIENESDEIVFQDDSNSYKTSLFRFYGTKLKILLLLVVSVTCSVVIMSNNAPEQTAHLINVPSNQTKRYVIEGPINDQIELTVHGAMLPYYAENRTENWLIISVENNNESWTIPICPACQSLLTYKKMFKTSNFSRVEIEFYTDYATDFPLSFSYNLEPIDPKIGIIYAALVFLSLYIVIIFELMSRTVAAMLASTVSIAILTGLNAAPSMLEVFSWMDLETIILLASMMILVTILGDTGIFGYMAVMAYKMTGGRIWPLINTLCVITAVLSCFLDNVTIALLTTPIIIRLCEVMKLNPVPVLSFTIIFANIGGCITPIGDPPNIILVSHPNVIEAGIHFGVFTLHMGVGTVIALVVVYSQLRWVYRDMTIFKFDEPVDVQELKREIAVLKRAAASLSSCCKDEDNVKTTLLTRSNTLTDLLRVRVKSHSINEEDHQHLTVEQHNYITNLNDLQSQYPIKNKPLLVKSGLILCLVITLFFLHSIPALSHLGLGMTAFLGALTLILFIDASEEVDGIFYRIEWPTLIFLASLFTMMEALTKLGLIDLIGNQINAIIMLVQHEEARLVVAILLILWVSAFVSAFVDNLPLATMMIRIVTNLSENRDLNLPLSPLLWALSFGAAFGGNGTLIGSSSNIVCAGIAEQQGYRFKFLEFVRIGLPAMITSLATVSVYLLICHVAFHWH